jgi:hypothetical protein
MPGATIGARMSQQVVLAPCQVPWMISPSMSGLTLVHSEGDIEPRCTVVVGGGRLTESGRTDSRRIELTFHECESSRLLPIGDDEELASKGYTLRSAARDVEISQYLKWFPAEWQSSGVCPESGLWVAIESPELKSLRAKGRSLYVVAGRNGYVELVASGFSWQEWIWDAGEREDLPASRPVAARGVSDELCLPRQA